MLSVHEVTTAYQGLVAISAVSIEVAKGEIVCVAGANGAGKSTLLKSIAGAERPRSGTVSFDGARIDGMAQHVITSRGIAYVPENRRLFPRLSVRDNLRLGSYLYRGEAYPRHRPHGADRRAACFRVPGNRRPRLHPANRPRADAGGGS